jgi:Tfp pilus assembly protein PilP
LTARLPAPTAPRRLLLAVMVLALAGCGSGRDQLLAEKVAQAEAAAQRAEKAQRSAEKTATAIKARLAGLPDAEQPRDPAEDLEDEGETITQTSESGTT